MSGCFAMDRVGRISPTKRIRKEDLRIPTTADSMIESHTISYRLLFLRVNESCLQKSGRSLESSRATQKTITLLHPKGGGRVKLSESGGRVLLKA